MFKIQEYRLRINALEHFRRVLESYKRLDCRDEALRAQINRSVSLISSYIRETGTSTSIYYSPPPIRGGLQGHIDLFSNLFHLPSGLSFQHIYDMIDKAIGIYTHWESIYWKVRLNPIFWVKQMIRFPFMIISFAGYNGAKVENTVWGKVWKGLGAISVIAAGIVAIKELIEAVPFFVGLFENLQSLLD